MAGVMITGRIMPATVARLNRFTIIVITGAIVPMKRRDVTIATSMLETWR